MKIKELIKHLNKFDENIEVMILDGFNGGGNPREINNKPIDLYTITEENERYSGDCDDMIGEEVVILGYGSY